MYEIKVVDLATDSPDFGVGRRTVLPCLVWGTWENKPCSVNPARLHNQQRTDRVRSDA